LGDHEAVGSNRARHFLKHPGRLIDVHQEESTKGKVHRFGQREVFTCLGDRDDLCLSSRSCARGDFISGLGIAVDCIYSTFTPHDRGKCS
jgi:hypothetical protein